MEIIEKFVDFEKYCETCEYKDLEEKYDPCHECLETPVNTGSEKPINYKEKETKENKKG